MNAKWLLPASLICGLIGGMVGQWIIPSGQNQKSVTFETVRVTKDMIVAPSDLPDRGCRLAADGTITATGGLVANQIRGNLIVGRSLLATLNATQQSLDQQQIAAELTANPESGGGLLLRSREGILCPANGPTAQGFETFVGFDKSSHSPSMYTQNIAQGPPGRAYLVCMTPKPKSSQPQSQPETANPTNQPSQQQPFQR